MANHIIRSWEENAGEWNRLIDKAKIASRNFTDNAILRFTFSLNGENILDIGCGEGWLTRALANKGRTVTGVDATAELIAKAKQKGPGHYYQLTYAEIVSGKNIPNAPFDIIVFNFSIYDEDKPLIKLLDNLSICLKATGKIVIQTLHPFYLIQKELPYQSQWMQNAWEGLPGNFTNGHKWYARTMEDWISVFKRAGLQLNNIKEIKNDDGQLLSIIFGLDKR